MKLSIISGLRGQFAKQDPVVRADLTGKTVVVLGASTGIGFQAAKHFSTMNPGRLILACRSQSRGQAAVEKLEAETGYAKAELWIIDLADFDSVKRFADKFEQDGGRLDIFVANAALSKITYEATNDGWESSLQVNDLSTPLVSLLLLPRMIQTAKEHSVVPRLVIVGSEVHYWIDIPKRVLESGNILKTLSSKEYCTKSEMRTRYMTTKLLNVLFTRALNAHLPSSTPLITNVVNPGLCASELNRDLTGPLSLLWGLFVRIFAWSSEVGSRRLVWAAVGGGGAGKQGGEGEEGLRGGYINKCRVDEPSDWVTGAEGGKAQERIWNELLATLGQVDPRVQKIAGEYLASTASSV